MTGAVRGHIVSFVSLMSSSQTFGRFVLVRIVDVYRLRPSRDIHNEGTRLLHS